MQRLSQTSQTIAVIETAGIDVNQAKVAIDLLASSITLFPALHVSVVEPAGQPALLACAFGNAGGSTGQGGEQFEGTERAHCLSRFLGLADPTKTRARDVKAFVERYGVLDFAPDYGAGVGLTYATAGERPNLPPPVALAMNSILGAAPDDPDDPEQSLREQLEMVRASRIKYEEDEDGFPILGSEIWFTEWIHHYCHFARRLRGLLTVAADLGQGLSRDKSSRSEAWSDAIGFGTRFAPYSGQYEDLSSYWSDGKRGEANRPRKGNWFRHVPLRELRQEHSDKDLKDMFSPLSSFLSNSNSEAQKIAFRHITGDMFHGLGLRFALGFSPSGAINVTLRPDSDDWFMYRRNEQVQWVQEHWVRSLGVRHGATPPRRRVASPLYSLLCLQFAASVSKQRKCCSNPDCGAPLGDEYRFRADRKNLCGRQECLVWADRIRGHEYRQRRAAKRQGEDAPARTAGEEGA